MGIDFKDDVKAFVQLIKHVLTRGPVIVSINGSMFQKAAIFDHFLKFLTGLEEIVLAVHFSLAGFTGRAGNGIGHVVPFLKEPSADGSFAGTARSRKDK